MTVVPGRQNGNVKTDSRLKITEHQEASAWEQLGHTGMPGCQIPTSFDKSDSGKYKIPLKGPGWKTERPSQPMQTWPQRTSACTSRQDRHSLWTIRPSSWSLQGGTPAAEDFSSSLLHRVPGTHLPRQDVRLQSRKSSWQLSTSRREEQPWAKAKQPASSPPSATHTNHQTTTSRGDSGGRAPAVVWAARMTPPPELHACTSVIHVRWT